VADPAQFSLPSFALMVSQLRTDQQHHCTSVFTNTRINACWFSKQSHEKGCGSHMLLKAVVRPFLPFLPHL
jgi:hypothetical protein